MKTDGLDEDALHMVSFFLLIYNLFNGKILLNLKQNLIFISSFFYGKEKKKTIT